MLINFFGCRGSGKTTTIKGQIKDCRPPVVIVDILGNYDSLEYYDSQSLPECIDAVKKYYVTKKEPRVICLKTSNPTVAADYLSAVIWEINGGTLILDEVDSIRMKEGSCFDEYIRYGRNHNGDLITGCRRPAELERNISAGANKFYCFQTHEPRDIEYFKSTVFGERAELLLHLPPHHGLFLDHDKKITGIFESDINGNIFHLEEESVKL